MFCLLMMIRRLYHGNGMGLDCTIREQFYLKKHIIYRIIRIVLRVGGLIISLEKYFPNLSKCQCISLLAHFLIIVIVDPPVEINQGRSQGERGEIPPPPRNRKKCCRKMVLFPKALFLVTNFRKK